MAIRATPARGLRTLVISGLALALVLCWVGWSKLLRERPQTIAGHSASEASPELLFKYGSIGAEGQSGIPYWIWLVLPGLFPEHLPGPGGYASLGLPWEPGMETPVGFSKKTIGVERVAVNCAICHTASVRTSIDAIPQIYPGGPSHTFDVLAYQRFLFACASDARFDADRILSAIAAIHELPLLDRLLYRYVLVPLTKKGLLEQRHDFAFAGPQPAWGRGRIDPFNPVKIGVLGFEPDGTIGASDMVPIWNLGLRQGMAYHWDGLNTDLREVFLSSAVGDGAAVDDLPLESLERLQEWLTKLEPPPHPHPVDAALSARGESVFVDHCSDCHAPGGTRTGQVVPWEQVRTDRHRIEMWTPEAAEGYNAFGTRNGLDFAHFRAPDGYVSPPLDGVWIRGPFLHNGSVPSLSALLYPDRRPSVFYRGLDVYDPVNVGYVSQGEEAMRVGTRYDVSEPGNGNQGHLWGAGLHDHQKAALIEYLKTL